MLPCIEMQTGDQMFGYACILLGAAPVATQLAISSVRWFFFFPIFAIPALTLLISVGHLSRTASVLTFRRIAPIAAGIGWALTWQIAEKLFVENIRAAQLFLYILFSARPSLNWAISCLSQYHTEYCINFYADNVTISEFHHHPDNFWPAQEFNRYTIRGDDYPLHFTDPWKTNEWYYGPASMTFYFWFPSLPLVIAHTVTWLAIAVILLKYSHRLNQILTKVCIALPLALYLAVVMGLTVTGFYFGKTTTEYRDGRKISENLADFWSNVTGGFRTSLTAVDYSTAFTGIVLFATSRLRSGAGQLNALYIVPAMMVVPAIQTIIYSGCEGHVTHLQPAYHVYISTEETVTFDLFPVCFATSTWGPLWSFLYFTAQYLYSSFGPMLVYSSLIYQSFIDEWPTIQNAPRTYISIFVACFTVPSFLLLYMPYGTKIVALLRYTSQEPVVQILAFVVIFFVYGWQRIEQDVLTTTASSASPSLFEYIIRPTSPVYTIAQFIIIPMLLCAKFVAIFDLLISGRDIFKHIEAGARFIPVATWLAAMIGYLIMFAPVVIVVAIASYTLFDMVVRHKLPFAEAIKPTADWMSHVSVSVTRPKPHSLAYGIYNSLLKVSYPTVLFLLFLFETFIGFTLVVLFFLNSLPLIGLTPTVPNNYRSCMLLVFVILHIIALFEMRRSQQNTEEPSRLSLYIGVATLEMAMLNGYMWMFASDHAWGLDWMPFVLILCNTWIRGTCIAIAIAVRANMIELTRPSRARDASEIYDADVGVEMDAEDDSPVIFDLARA
ncbi:unnamed protein product [Caenorhabditis auriculariae]|uniref:Uncharacterized protein n=1 Tax=Caenorhabditis auriculariae TaxID=2777116 RepID=A0A8S1HMT1_9PELO|nr:unnamed protein product [Caenorhabditis auriculariae]